MQSLPDGRGLSHIQLKSKPLADHLLWAGLAGRPLYPQSGILTTPLNHFLNLQLETEVKGKKKRFQSVGSKEEKKHATKSQGNQPSVLFIFDFTGNHGKPEPNLVPSCVLQSLTTVQTETEVMEKGITIKGGISLAQLALEKALPETFSRDPTLNMKWPGGLESLCSSVWQQHPWTWYFAGS